MSNETLRDRIATVIAGEEDYPHPRGYAAHAQAIIDELGLTKEWQPVSRQILNDGTAIENPTQSRIVGKWEPECHR